MEGILVAIVVYIVSVISGWFYVKLAHSKNGVWKNVNTDSKDVFVTFCPIINTLFIVGWVIEFPIKSEFNFNKFFNVRK